MSLQAMTWVRGRVGIVVLSSGARGCRGGPGVQSAALCARGFGKCGQGCWVNLQGVP